MNILWAMIWFLALGLAFGLILAFAGKTFKVETDGRIELIADTLPKANCGGCGYAGCEALAEAIAKGEAKTNKCPVGGDEMCAAIAEIMGEPALSGTRYRAQVMCSGTNDLAAEKYEYDGIEDCIAASGLAGGSKACRNGCLGLGTCVKNCKFGAIKIINGVAAVDYEKCTACGACAASCPKSIIALIPFGATHWVGCISTDKGAVTRKNCAIGCIACKLCEKKCPAGAIKISDFNATVEYEKCTSCGDCEKSCPRRVIWSNVSQKHEGIVREKDSVGDVEQ
ncbi:MAG: RnfABCDGE type electron transport complex subunit B [Oscillospiraceae bacterium]|nr:RnfABCDGE type electron transport complex subunit B [Oscillospiraceae bacterium]